MTVAVSERPHQRSRRPCTRPFIVAESEVAVEQIPTPEIGPGEVLIRVEACGVCHTDLKKVEYNLLPPPRVYGHETAGVVVKDGRGCQPICSPATA